MVIQQEISPYIKSPNFTHGKGRMGRLFERDFGTSCVAGTVDLYVDGLFKDQHEFKTKKERQLIFGMWIRKYGYRDNVYFQVRYSHVNLQDRLENSPVREAKKIIKDKPFKRPVAEYSNIQWSKHEI